MVLLSTTPVELRLIVLHFYPDKSAKIQNSMKLSLEYQLESL